MNMMSSDNSYYTYSIDTLEDLSLSAFNRRNIKAKKNNKNCFCFEINFDFSHTVELKDFLSTHLKKDDLIIAGFSIFEFIKNEINVYENIYLRISHNGHLVFLQNSSYTKSTEAISLLFNPKTTDDLKKLLNFYKNKPAQFKIFWRFEPYDAELKRSITVKDINNAHTKFDQITGLEIFNTKVPKHFELEPNPENAYYIKWKFFVKESEPIISIIIPTYNNCLFLSNVVQHLVNQNCSNKIYEVIICDDGSQDHSAEIIYDLYSKFSDKINLKYIYWSKKNDTRGDQFFFRSGLARNLASHYATSEYLLFLDSDILVPNNFIETAINSLKNNDIIQFQRFHLHQDISKKNPVYHNINLKTETYIEEKTYWSELFYCKNWADLPNYWKYTCTYALGIKKSNFYKIGLFKKYYISYGFEDTDLGYESHKRNFKFELIKMPLLHLTAYNHMQYKNSFSKRIRLLKVTAELFYLQHLDKNIYYLLGDYFRTQKPLKSFIRDLIN